MVKINNGIKWGNPYYINKKLLEDIAMKNFWTEFWNDEDGLEVIEVILILGIVVGIALAFQGAIGEWWESLKTKISTAIEGFNVE